VAVRLHGPVIVTAGIPVEFLVGVDSAFVVALLFQIIILAFGPMKLIKAARSAEGRFTVAYVPARPQDISWRRPEPISVELITSVRVVYAALSGLDEEVVEQIGFFEIPWVIEGIVFSFTMGILCAIVAHSLGHLAPVWFCLGLLFNILALILILSLPSLKRARIKVEPPKLCSYCGASNSRAFRFCVCCGKPFKKGLITVPVHHFQIWNNRIGDWEIPHAKRTAMTLRPLTA
jgi:hypothetical protein